MKKRFFLVLIIQSAVSYSQTAITSANFQEAINTCLATNPIDGLCSTSEFGAMPGWDVSNVTDMSMAFHQKTVFNGDLRAWDVSNVTDMNAMFYNAIDFNSDISNWDTSNVTNMNSMFTACRNFNSDISAWNVSNVTDMTALFNAAFSFNQDISTKEITVGENTFIAWDVSNVNNMAGMFLQAKVFNRNISNWDTSNVSDMRSLFRGASVFNGDIGSWDVSNVSIMRNMFFGAHSFNQQLNDWDTSNVNIMLDMFAGASAFNQSLNDWDTSNVTSMPGMFAEASAFNGDIGSWDVSSVTNMGSMFSLSGFSTNNYDAILNSWSQQDVQSGVTLGAAGINYCNGADARQSLEDNNGWIITDAGLDCSTASIDDQNQLDISIYPNPTSDIVYIDGNYTQLKVIIYNVLGKEILNKSITNSIDISHLDNGVYILQLSDGVKLITRKIIKN